MIEKIEINKITLRYQKVSDAEDFYMILNSPGFTYFPTKPKSVASEKKWLRNNPTKKKFHYNYAIVCKNYVVGGCGIRIDQHRKYIGEIGYFVDEIHWGKGIASQAVKLLEKIAFKKLKLKRIVVSMHPQNKASERVAVK